MTSPEIGLINPQGVELLNGFRQIVEELHPLINVEQMSDRARFKERRIRDPLHKRFFEAAGLDYKTIKAEVSGLVRGITMRGSKDEGRVINLTYAEADLGNEADMADFTDAPEDFQFPGIAIIHHDEVREEVKTPYGVLASDVLDTRGHVFCFSNTYFIDKNGNMSRYESVVDMGDWKKEKTYTEQEVEEIPRSLLQMKESDSWVVKADQGDYDLVKGYFEAIKVGDFVQIKDQSSG